MADFFSAILIAVGLWSQQSDFYRVDQLAAIYRLSTYLSCQLNLNFSLSGCQVSPYLYVCVYIYGKAYFDNRIKPDNTICV